MSKIGKKNIEIPKDVKAAIAGNILNLEGPKGKRSIELKNDVLDVLVFNPYNPSSGVPNFVTRLIANFCDYNKSIVIDKMNKLDENTVSFTCIKRN